MRPRSWLSEENSQLHFVFGDAEGVSVERQRSELFGQEQTGRFDLEGLALGGLLDGGEVRVRFG